MPSHCTTSSDNCIGCGTCILVCPKRLLILDNGRPKMIEGREHLCNDCGQCTAYCPVGAAIHNGILAADLEKTSMPSSSASKTIIQVLKQRRSYRSFSSQSVKQSDLEKILEVVGYAPSGGNNRFLRLIITKPETTKKFLELIAQWFDGDCRTRSGLRQTLCKQNRFHPRALSCRTRSYSPQCAIGCFQCRT